MNDPSLKDYMSMEETEKNRMVQQALIRLQNRIYEIVYLMESEIGTGLHAGREKEKEINPRNHRPKS